MKKLTKKQIHNRIIILRRNKFSIKRICEFLKIDRVAVYRALAEDEK